MYSIHLKFIKARISSDVLALYGMLAELYTGLSTSISMHAMECYLKTPVDEHQCDSVANCYIVLQDEVPSIVDCPDPDHMTPHERRVARIAHEEASFDAEYYLYNILPGAQLPHGDAAHPRK